MANSKPTNNDEINETHITIEALRLDLWSFLICSTLISLKAITTKAPDSTGLTKYVVSGASNKPMSNTNIELKIAAIGVLALAS